MGYSYKDKCSFTSLHMLAFILHAISASLAFYLAPTEDDLSRDVVYQKYNYTVDSAGVPYVIAESVDAFKANSIWLIAVNEAVASASHLVGFLLVTCIADASSKYDKKTGIKRRDRYDYKG